jgi:hypothetical protein
VALTLAMLLPTFSGCTAAPAWNGSESESENFDGVRFVNADPMEKSMEDFIRLGWGALTTSHAWPQWVEYSPQVVPRDRVYTGVSVITWTNRAFCNYLQSRKNRR